jgi:hypothetical protein
LKKNRWFTETAPSGFGKPTGLPPVFTGFVNRGLGSLCFFDDWRKRMYKVVAGGSQWWL